MTDGTWRLSKDARRDVRGIARYTRAEWGREQAERYSASLDAAFDRLAEYPELGPERAAIRPGIRVLPVERHLIVYRLDREGVLILRVIHQSVNLTEMELP